MYPKAKQIRFNLLDMTVSKSPSGRLVDAEDLAQLTIVHLRLRNQGIELNLLERERHSLHFMLKCASYPVGLEVGVQELWAGESSGVVRIPDPDIEVVPGVAWGTAEVPNTPAYWSVRCRWEGANPDYVTKQATLVEETGFCLLGGYGIKYEVNAAAFIRLQAASVFDLNIAIGEAEILTLLKAPLWVNGREVRYRFPNQRARRLTSMRDSLRKVSLTGRDPHGMRQALLAIEGIGPKTASWIVRNVLGSDEVAIIDIHILRACIGMGVFPSDIRLPRDYEPLEQRFIAFSHAIDVRPSVLDAVMWSEMRSVPAKTWSHYHLDS